MVTETVESLHHWPVSWPFYLLVAQILDIWPLAKEILQHIQRLHRSPLLEDFSPPTHSSLFAHRIPLKEGFPDELSEAEARDIETQRAWIVADRMSRFGISMAAWAHHPISSSSFLPKEWESKIKYSPILRALDTADLAGQIIPDFRKIHFLGVFLARRSEDREIKCGNDDLEHGEHSAVDLA
jgi:hypothetical protein